MITLRANVGWTSVRQKGNKLPPTMNIILFLSQVHSHVNLSKGVAA